MNDALPSDDTRVTIYGWRCQSCGLRTPEDYMLLAVEERLKMRQQIEKGWERGGRGEWLQGELPHKYPAWMVREGFRCGFCQAPNVLLALTP